MMYNHRILSLIIFSTLFYLTSLLSAAGVWALFWAYSASKPTAIKPRTSIESTDSDTASDGRSKQDQEDDDADSFEISDTPRTFPTSSRQPRLRYLPTPRATPEAEQEESLRPSVEAQPSALEADDEDDIPEGSRPGWRTDSGIGTSMEEGSERAVRRRRKT